MIAELIEKRKQDALIILQLREKNQNLLDDFMNAPATNSMMKQGVLLILDQLKEMDKKIDGNPISILQQKENIRDTKIVEKRANQKSENEVVVAEKSAPLKKKPNKLPTPVNGFVKASVIFMD